MLPIWPRSMPPGRTSPSTSGQVPATAAKMASSPGSAAPCARRLASQAHPDPTRASEDSPMRDLINYAVFGWYPYLCLTVFLLGSCVRFDREQYTWRSGSSQLLRRRQLAWGSNLFHVGILVIFFGHFVGLLTPIWVFDFLGISHTFKQWMAIIIGGVAGVFCFIGMMLLIHRRLFDSNSQNLVVRRHSNPPAALRAAHPRACDDRRFAQPPRRS